METDPNKDIPSISKGLVDLVSKQLHEERDTGDVNIFKFLSIKKKDSEQDENHLFTDLIKKEKDDLEDAFKFEHFSRNTNRQDISDSFAMDFNKSNYFSVKPTKNDGTVENITMTYEIKKSDEITFNEWKIKNEEVDIKTEDPQQLQNSMSDTCFGYETHEELLNKNENRSDDHKTQERSIKKRLTHQIKPGQWFKCCHCNYQTLSKKYIERHIPKHKNPDDVKLFKCDQCDYQTIRNRRLKYHALRHKNPEDVVMFKCDHCDYQTRYKDVLKRHALRHKNPGDVKMLKCDQCDYQTISKRNLKRHALRHKNPEDVKLFKCYHCDYQTRYKDVLKKHALRHKNPEDVEMFKCYHCDYQTLYKNNLKKHTMKHKNL